MLLFLHFSAACLSFSSVGSVSINDGQDTGFTVINGVFDSTPGDLDGVRAMVKMFRTAFPDAQFTIDEQIAEGNKVVSRLTIHAIHQGDFNGLAATGKPVTMNGISIWELGEGKLLQERVIWDTLGMLQQLGALPPAT